MSKIDVKSLFQEAYEFGKGSFVLGMHKKDAIESEIFKSLIEKYGVTRVVNHAAGASGNVYNCVDDSLYNTTIVCVTDGWNDQQALI